LGSKHELAHIEKIMAEGTGADRQLRVWEQSGGDLKAVVDQIITETYEGLILPSRPNDRRRPRRSAPA
jgi:glutamate---cysteine ligase / carboxylate-amine ligase